MDLFEQYQKDWKHGKANQESNPLSNLKNKEIMDQLMRFEQAEDKQIRKGAIRGAVGILIGLGCAITAMVLGEVLITPTIIGGVILMIFSLIFSAYNMLQKDPLQAVDQTTTDYLKLAKERLIIRKHKIKNYTIVYVVLIIIGMGMITSTLPYCVLVALVIGMVTYYYWDVKSDPYLILQLEVLDEKIANLK